MTQLAGLEITMDDPVSSDVPVLLERHLAYSHQESPEDHDHAPDRRGWTHPSITVFSARRHGVVLGVGALREPVPATAR